jgi:F-type H+-transporting ATPase subunit a
MEQHHPFTWLGAAGIHDPTVAAFATSGIVAAGLVAFALRVRPKLADTERALEPDSKVTARGIAEALTEAISGIAEAGIGHHSERFVPLLGTFFVLILCSNLFGLLPGFIPPTSNINLTLGLGLVAFLMYNVYGIQAHKASYVKQFLGPMALMAPLMLVIELVSHAFRPASLGIRLFANMFADHQVLETFTSLTKVVVPVIFYAFGSFVCLVQAFVFTMLTAVYIGLAISHDH